MNDLSRYQIDREKAGLLVIDIQDRLAAAMDQDGLALVSKNTGRLLVGAQTLEVPVIVTEQYPKGIGPTIDAVKEHFPEDLETISKIDFSCALVEQVMEQIKASGRTQWILCGMEAHICVYQTARDLVKHGYQVFIPQDAVISRFAHNIDVGIRLMEKTGSVISSTEAVLFDMLKKAGTPEFKVISKLVR